MKLSSSFIELHKNGKSYMKGFINGKFQEVEIPIKPFAYVDAKFEDYLKREGRVSEIEDGYMGDDHKPVVKFICDTYEKYYYVRNKLKSMNARLYETDITTADKVVYYEKARVEYTPDNVAFLDIEVDDSHGFPDPPGEFTIYSIAVSDYNGNQRWFYIGDYNGDEAKMLKHLEIYLMSAKKTVIVGYNVKFDYQHLVERMKKLGVRSIFLEVCDTVDMYALIRASFKGLPDYKLDTVAHHFLGVGKVPREKRIVDMTREELMKYNMRDATLLPEIDAVTEVVKKQIPIANTMNIPIRYLNATKLWDILLARSMHEVGIVMRIKYKFGEHVKYTGAMVKQPKYGLYFNVVDLDITSLYPSIIMDKKVDILDYKGAFLPKLLKKYFDLRQQYKKIRNQYEKGTPEYTKYDLLQWSYKIIINSAYGIFGNPGFRYYDPDKAHFITSTGQNILREIMRYVEDEIGYSVVYGDTDSVFVQLPHSVDMDGALLLADMVNEHIRPYKVKVEAIFKKLLIPESSTRKGVGSKKRYAYLTTDGKLEWTGIELVRGDVPPITKTVMRRVIEMILLEEASYGEIKKYLAGVYNDVMSGNIPPEEFIITKGVKDNPDEYATTGPHIRAFKQAYEQGYRSVDGTISFVFANGDVVPIIKESDLKKAHLNYNVYWNTYIKAPIDRITKAVFDTQSSLSKWL